MTESKSNIQDQLAAFRAKKAKEKQYNEWKSRFWDKLYSLVLFPTNKMQVNESSNTELDSSDESSTKVDN